MAMPRLPYLAVALLAAVTVGGQPTAADDDGLIHATDSGKEVELQIARALKARLNVEPDLRMVGDDVDDLRLDMRFPADEQRDLPPRTVLLDTAILGRNGDEVVAQVIRLVAYPAVAFDGPDRARLLEWANEWNYKTILPVRLAFADDRLVATTQLITYANAPLSEDQVLNAFSWAVQVWPHLLADLRQNDLL